MADTIYLLPESGNYYKANLHTHTTVSDGRLTPEQMKQAYKNQGYSVMCFSDHNKLVRHHHLNEDDFLMLDGFERDTYKAAPRFVEMKTTHMNFIDTNPAINTAEKEAATKNWPPYGDAAAMNKFLAQMNDLGFLSFYNHPYWSLETFCDIKDFDGFWGFEIYNHGCEIDGMNGYAWQTYNEMLRRGKGNLFCVMTDDNHNGAPLDSAYNDSFGGFTMINASSLTYKNIISSLKKGSFYCSMGPKIHSLRLEGDMLHIECDPVVQIFVSTGHRGCYRALANKGETITSASFKIDKNDMYVRVTIKTYDGKFADTNPFWINDILT